MSAMSDYLEGQLRAHIFRTSSFTKPTVLAVALCSSAPTDASTGATIPELSNANGYARVALNPLDANWTAASSTDGLTDNASAITFAAVTTTAWAAVTHFALVDSATYGAGNVLFWGALTRSDLSAIGVLGVGDVLTIAIGDLNVTFA
jgi:hypothetical protein